MYEDDGVAVDEEDDDDDEEATDVAVDEDEEEEILDVEDLLKTKNRTNVQLVEIGTESGFHDIYDRKQVTFYGGDGDPVTDDNNNSSSHSNKTDKRKSGGSSHSSFSSSSTSSGIISANNDEFKIIMKNNYECTLLMVNNDAQDEDDDEEEEEESSGRGIRGFRMRQNGYGTLKTAANRPTTTDREFNKRMSFSGDMAEIVHRGEVGDNEQQHQQHAVYFNGSQSVMNQSFISADGVTRVLVVDGKGGSNGIGGGGGLGKRDDDHHIPKCMKLMLGR